MELLNYTMGGILEKWASETPDKEFLVYSDRNLRFTYAEFNDRVDNIAKALHNIGVGKDDKVGVWAKNIPDWLTYLFAANKLGAIMVTVNTNYKSAELKYILQNADIHTMCLVNGYGDSDYVEIMYDLVPELKKCQRGNLKSETFPKLRNVVYMGQEKVRGMYSTSELIAMGSYLSNDIIDKIRPTLDAKEDVCMMQYTSGTTGFPKGVMLTHRNILNNGLFTGEAMEYTDQEKLLVCVPLFHCFGCVLALCAIITHGATMVMVESFDALKVLASVHKERCTAIYGVPTMFIAELNHPMFDMFDLTSLRTGIMAGALCPIETMKEVMERMHVKDIISVYGLTETSPGMTVTCVTDTMEQRATTVGRHFPYIDVKVLNPETNEECPVGVQGEMCCKGWNLMKGYYNNPEATAEIIDENGYLHSGDLGVMDEDGFFRITGRIKEMIIRGGENIYPREIENFLYEIPEIEDVQVAAIDSPRYGEEVGAFIRLRKDCQLNEEDVRMYCRGKIARYKIPKYIFFVDSFPLTASGKIQKYKFKEIAVKLLAERGVTVI